MIDITKKYKTRNGREVKLWEIDGKVVNGKFRTFDESWKLCWWNIETGAYDSQELGEYPLDLVELDLMEVKNAN